MTAVHPRSRYEAPLSKWDDPLRLLKRAPRAEDERVQPNKVKIARQACEVWPSGELGSDLSTQMQRIIDFIRDANGATGPLPIEPAG